MTSASDLTQLTNLLLGATCDPKQWSMVIEKLARLHGANKGGLEFSDLGSGRTVIQADYGLGPAFRARYAQQFGPSNPFASKRTAFLLGRVVDAAKVIPPGTLHKTAFYREFLRPHGIEHMLCAVLFQERDLHGFLNLTRSKGMRPFSPREAALLQSLIPALQATLLVNRRLNRHAQEQKQNADLLDRFQRGVVLLDPRGKAVSINRYAWTILEGRDGLRLEKNGIQAVQPEENRRFKRLLRAAVSGADPKEMSLEDRLMLVTRTYSETPLSIFVAPLTNESPFPRESPARAVVFICDPDRCASGATDALRELYGFTKAEARLALCLLGGLSLEECAPRLGITLNTVRTQIKRLFLKTSTSRQGDLIRVLLESPATLHME